MSDDPELKVTLICKDCSNQYGRWRPQCPTCGTKTPARDYASPSAPATQPKLTRTKLVTATLRRVRAIIVRLSSCIVCRRAGAKLTCPHCDERIHKGCLSLHHVECKAFQVLRAAEIVKLDMKEKS